MIEPERLYKLKLKHWLKAVLVSIFFLTILGCAQLQTGINFFSRPKVISHKAPTLSPVNFSPFENQDCPKGDYGHRRCADGTALKELGCDWIEVPEPWLGGLTPTIPLARCLSRTGQAVGPPSLYIKGCPIPSYVNYVTEENGIYRLIYTTEDLKAAFAPISSPEEALSYAVAATGLQPRFDIHLNPFMRYQTQKLEDTYVEQVPGGYRVHLFHFELCGCGPNFWSTVTVDVSQNGDRTVGKSTPIYEEPALDPLCLK